MNTRISAVSAIILLLFTLSAAKGQEGPILDRLAVPDGPGGASIVVNESGEAASIIRMAASTRRNNTISAYRVRIFFDNSQNARSNAYGTQSWFRELFPDIPVDLKYEAPYFRVTAGYCLTKEEAIILWGRIKDAFPKAFLIPQPETVSLETFIRYGAAGVSDPETPEEAEE